MKSTFEHFYRDERGATAIEYGLIAAIIGIGIALSITNVSAALNSLFDIVENGFPT